MLTQTIDYVLVPDSSSARRLRRLISAESARLGLVVGTWSELVEMASRAYLIDVTETDEWQDTLHEAVATVEDAFWNKSFEVAPDEVIQYLSSSLQSLLSASSSLTLNFPVEKLSKLNPRAMRHFADLRRLHEQMGMVLLAELIALEQISRVEAQAAGFAIRIYRHQDIPLLTRHQTLLVNKLEADFGPGSDKVINTLLSSLFENNGDGTTGSEYLQNNLFAPNIPPIALDDSLQWLAVRDYREEVTIAVSMVQELLANDKSLSFADIGILLPDSPEYTGTLINLLDKTGIPHSGLSGSFPLRDLGYELIRDFIAALQPPALSMALASLFSSPLLPWSSTVGNRFAQAIMDGNGCPEDNRVTELITESPESPDELSIRLSALLGLIFDNEKTAQHLVRVDHLVTELSTHLEDCTTIDWKQLERLLSPQKLSYSAKPFYHQEGIGIFLATQEPWRNCHVLFVLGLTAGNYPAAPSVSPVFSQEDLGSMNANLGLDLVNNRELLQRRRNLFKRQLQTATDEVSFFVPLRDGCGESLSLSESLIFMAQLFAGIDSAEDLLLYCDSSTDRTRIRYLNYVEATESHPLRDLESVDLQLGCNLLALRTDQDGNQKPESPSGLETLMVSPLAWLLRRYRMEAKEWGIDTLDAMTRGSLAHRVFEQLFAPGQPLPDAATIIAQLPQLLQISIREIFPLLERAEWRVEQRNLQREIEVAALRWSDMLKEIDATVIGVEETLRGSLDSLPLSGIADLLLSLPNGRMLVVDYKKAKSPARMKRMEQGYDSQANLYRIMMETGGAMDGRSELQKTLKQATEIGVMYYLLNDQTALSDSINWIQNNIAGWHKMGDAISDNAMVLIRERIQQLEDGQIILNSMDEESSYEKEMGIKPYAFDDSPLVKLFMKGV